MSNCKCLAACVLFVFTGGDAMAFGEEMRSVSVAAISFVPRKFDLENNAEKLEQMFRRASAGSSPKAFRHQK